MTTPSTTPSGLLTTHSVILAVEGFATILLVDVAAAVANLGGSVDLSTTAGRAAVVTAVVGGVALAVKSWAIKSLGGN